MFDGCNAFSGGLQGHKSLRISKKIQLKKCLFNYDAGKVSGHRVANSKTYRLI